jgi:septal ring factor EnvC (AmiA/AmiB activator)
MKEDKLENFVRENAEDFNSLEPPVMAWDVIDKELPAPKQKRVRKLWPYAWKAAAAILIFASAWMLNDFIDQKKSTEDMYTNTEVAVSSELSELSDAEAYYTTQISSKQAELARYARQNPEIIEDLKREFSEMDKSKAELKKDLAESNADEKVIEAIILSYRVKLEILDQMLTELRKSKEGNTPQKAVETNL